MGFKKTYRDDNGEVQFLELYMIAPEEALRRLKYEHAKPSSIIEIIKTKFNDLLNNNMLSQIDHNHCDREHMSNLFCELDDLVEETSNYKNNVEFGGETWIELDKFQIELEHYLLRICEKLTQELDNDEL